MSEKIGEIFSVRYGVNLELNSMIIDDHGIPFVSRTVRNNGVSSRVKEVAGLEANPPHTLSVAAGGSVLATFYQSEPYYSGRDLFYLVPKEKMNVMEMLFYAKCIESNKYRYNYGRQANKTLNEITVPKLIDVRRIIKKSVCQPPRQAAHSLQRKYLFRSRLVGF